MSFTRALVTGGSGFLGSHLCEWLLRHDVDVVCLDNFATGAAANVAQLEGKAGFTMLEHDVTQRFPVEGAFDLVAHLASAASPPDYFGLPVETLRAGAVGTANALDFARAHGARFLLASTSEVYGDPLVHPQPETYWGNVNPIGPRSVYDEAKRYAEALTTAYRHKFGVDTTIARIFNTYGPRLRPDDGRMIPSFVCQALTGRPLTVTGRGDQTRSVCYVDDTVRGLAALAASGHPGPVNLGNPDERPVLALAREILEVTGAHVPIRHVAAAVDDPQRRCPDISLATSVLDWCPEISFSEGISRTVAWFTGHFARASLR